jgi:hypothetical protein
MLDGMEDQRDGPEGAPARQRSVLEIFDLDDPAVARLARALIGVLRGLPEPGTPRRRPGPRPGAAPKEHAVG